MQRDSASHHRGFALLEALFCLLLTSFAFGILSFYLSLPKPPIHPQQLIYPSNIISESQMLLQSRGLAFEVIYQELQEGENMYFSFEVR